MSIKFLKNCLLQIGLSSKASKLYIQLVEDRDLGVSDLSKINKISRMTVYKLLEELKKFGLVIDSVDFRNGIRIQEPDHILSELYNKEKQIISDINSLSQILPQIKKHYFEKQDDYITIYQGKTQLQKLYLAVLASSKNRIKAIGNVQAVVDLVGEDLDYQWFLDRVKSNIWLDLLTFESELVNKHIDKGDKEKRTIKLLPKEFYFEGYILMNENLITFWNPILPKAISIKDPTFYTMFSNIFEIMWNRIS